MVRHSRKGKDRFAAVRVNDTFLLGALASLDMTIATLLTMGNEAWMVSADLTWGWNANVAGEGPVQVGLAHGDYTSAEVEEWIESTGSADPGDKISQEQSRRSCRDAGLLAGIVNFTMNDGRPKRTKLNMRIEDGKALSVFGYNAGSGTLTTGSAVSIIGKVYVKWQ